jgi:hypothetical protein
VKRANGEPIKARPDEQPMVALCAETQGRQIVAAMVNEAVEEALGLGLRGHARRANGQPKATGPEAK